MGSWKSELKPYTYTQITVKMYKVFATALLVSTVTGRPDGPGGHHGHHGHHGDHGAVHHGDHGAVHHVGHGSVSLGSTHQVGGVVHVSPVHPVSHPVHVVHSAPVQAHTVHTVQPVHSHPSVHGDTHHNPHNSVASSPAVVKSTPKTIADIVVGNPKFSTLLTAVQAAGLVETLQGEGPFTVFAPTNTAFDKVPVDALNSLLADKEKLKAVLLRHVIAGSAVQGKNIPPGSTTLKTVGGEEITATRDKFIQINSSAGSAYVVLFDQLADNGVVNAVDTVF